MTRGQPLEQRFWTKVRKTDSCWFWLGAKTGTGYGNINVGGKWIGAHILSYITIRGQVPDGLELDHLCRNRACVNPDHLEAVTHRENLLRGKGFSAKHANQKSCIHGHLFNESNTRLKRLKTGRVGRDCRSCDRDRQRVKYHLKIQGDKTDTKTIIPEENNGLQSIKSQSQRGWGKETTNS